MLYKICFDKSIISLEKEVREYISKGYKPRGELILKGEYLCQVMIKEKS